MAFPPVIHNQMHMKHSASSTVVNCSQFLQEFIHGFWAQLIFTRILTCSFMLTFKVQVHYLQRVWMLARVEISSFYSCRVLFTFLNGKGVPWHYGEHLTLKGKYSILQRGYAWIYKLYERVEAVIRVKRKVRKNSVRIKHISRLYFISFRDQWVSTWCESHTGWFV